MATNGDPTPLRLTPTTGDADIVTELEHLLERARTGEVIAIAYAATIRGGAIRTGWQESADGPWDCWRLISGVEQLRSRMHREIEDRS